MIRLVCFDLGGVLVRHCRSWAEGCAAAGIDVRGSSASPEASAARREIATRFMRGLLTPSEFYAEMSRACNGLYTPSEIELVHDAWLQGEYAGVADVVRTLINKDRAATGVLSNTNAAHWARLCADGDCAGQYPSVALLQNRHASHLLGMVKPDPALFREFERRAGVSAGEILFFEDLPENAAAAREAGWRVCQIDFTIETAGQIEGALCGAGLI